MTRRIGTLGAVDENISGAGINKILIFGIAVMAIALLISVVANTGGSTGLTAKILGDSNPQPPTTGADTGNLNLAGNKRRDNSDSGSLYRTEVNVEFEKIPRYPANPTYGILEEEYEINSLPYAIIYTAGEKILNEPESHYLIRITHFEVDEKKHKASYLVENWWQDTVILFKVHIIIKLENGEEMMFYSMARPVEIPPNKAIRIETFRRGEDINSEIATIKFVDHIH